MQSGGARGPAEGVGEGGEHYVVVDGGVMRMGGREGPGQASGSQGLSLMRFEIYMSCPMFQG